MFTCEYSSKLCMCVCLCVGGFRACVFSVFEAIVYKCQWIYNYVMWIKSVNYNVN